MVGFSFYITEELNKKIEQRVNVTGKSKSKVMREALEKGLKRTRTTDTQSQVRLI